MVEFATTNYERIVDEVERRRIGGEMSDALCERARRFLLFNFASIEFWPLLLKVKQEVIKLTWQTERGDVAVYIGHKHLTLVKQNGRQIRCKYHNPPISDFSAHLAKALQPAPVALELKKNAVSFGGIVTSLCIAVSTIILSLVCHFLHHDKMAYLLTFLGMAVAGIGLAVTRMIVHQLR